jgi:hypothetical protein
VVVLVGVLVYVVVGVGVVVLVVVTFVVYVVVYVVVVVVVVDYAAGCDCEYLQRLVVHRRHKEFLRRTRCLRCEQHVYGDHTKAVYVAGLPRYASQSSASMSHRAVSGHCVRELLISWRRAGVATSLEET